jgi:hypothetical protein
VEHGVKKLPVIVVLMALSFAQPTSAPKLVADDAMRVAEFYGLALPIEDKVWAGWSKVPSPLLSVTAGSEFVTQRPAPPTEFKQMDKDLLARPRE